MHRKKRIDTTERERWIYTIQKFLEARQDVVFAYLFGSFVREQSFRDVDVAVFLDPPPNSPLLAELQLEEALSQVVQVPVDVRVLNQAPVGFLYQVFKEGKCLVDRDPDRRVDFVCWVFRAYFDIARFRREYLREVSHAPV